jgi:hypothetical protein
MHLTTQQQQTLKTYIQADPVLGTVQPGAEGAFTISVALAVNASPAFIVWRSDVKSDEIGNAWIGTDIDGMSSLNMQRLQLMLQSSSTGIYDMRRSDRRAGFENPFGTNVSNGSRVAMRAAWKRNANVMEKLFATGTGSDASPAVTAVEGTLSVNEVGQVMGWAF